MNELDKCLSLKNLFLNIAEGIALHELVYDELGQAINYRVIDCNPQFELVLGIPKSEAIGKLATDLYHVTEAPFLKEYVEVATSKQHRLLEVDFPPMEKDFSISVTPWGEHGFATIFTDTTKQKRTQRALEKHLESINVRLRLMEFSLAHKTKDFLRYALDEICSLLSSTIGFFHFVEADQEHISLQAWSSLTLEKFCTAAPTENHYAISKAGLWTECIRQRKTVLHNDYASVPGKKGLPPGHSEVVRQLCAPIFRDQKIVAILGVGNKTTQYNETDSRLAEYMGDVVFSLYEAERAKEISRENSSLLERYFSSSLDLLCIADSSGTFHRLNPQWSDVLGYNIKDLEGKSFLQFVHPDDLESTLKEMAHLREHAQVLNFTNRYRAMNGSYHWIEWRSFPEGNMIYAVARDITKVKQTELEHERLIKELQQKNGELERFAYTVSHDLKSPLVTIQGFATSVSEDLVSGDHQGVTDGLMHIHAATIKMGRLLQDILQLSRLGRETAAFLPTSLNTVLQEVKDLLHGALESQQIELVLAPGLPVVMGDALRLRELFQNLCENAIKYRNPKIKAEIHVSCAIKEDMNVIEVSDNGIGIEPRHLTVIFDLFRKLNPRTDGTGVGLALVKRIAELHFGQVEARSEGLGKGSTFAVSLPLCVE